MKMKALKRWSDYLREPIDGSSLAVFRICFSAVMVFHLLWMGKHAGEYTQPQYHFSYFQGMPAPSAQVMVILLGALTFLAANVGLGLFYRVSSILLFLGSSYVFLLDKSYYSNYAYLLCLLSFLMCLLPANRIWSFDASGGSKSQSVPRWSVAILKFQFVIVYFFSGIAKLNSDWMNGQMAVLWMMPHSRYPILSQIIHQPWAAHAITYSGVFLDFAVCILLTWRRTFWVGAAVVLISQLLNFHVLMGSSAPWLTIAAVGLFAPPAWPRALLKAVGFPQSIIGIAQPERTENVEAELDATICGVAGAANASQSTFKCAPTFSGSSVLILLHVYAFVQILVPLRHFFYGGNTGWTAQGSRFSWVATSLNNKNVSRFDITVVDRRTGAGKKIDCTKMLSQLQFSNMIVTPDMILQFAHYIADREQAATGSRPIVKVTAIASLNDRTAQDLIAPDVDLAAQPESLSPASWIVPLHEAKSRTALGQGAVFQ
jgi:hypothetical protein